MILTDLELNNYRKHRRLQLKFKDGVTGIVGDNATGKSTIIEAILFALTGELFSGKRDDAISLGEDSGYVTIKFILNGKPGVLQRWLVGSKVELTYDGPKLKKATEVKELWDKLLQVGPEIISKVIIAQQGNIPMLFSGDNAIREKVMQKIFLVPNVEKIRNSINKNYLKQIPPLLAIEDVVELANNIQSNTEEISTIKQEIKEIRCLTEDEVDAYKKQLQYLIKCENDAGARLIVKQAINEQKVRIAELQASYDELSGMLASINIKDYEKQRNTLLQQKSLYAQKLKLEAKLIEMDDKLVAQSTIDIYTKEVEKAEKELAELKDDALRAKIIVENAKKQIDQLSGLANQAKCYTCGQPLHAIAEILAKLKEEMAYGQKLLTQGNTSLKQTQSYLNETKATLKDLLDRLAEEQRVVETLAQFQNIEFSEEDLTAFTEVIETYNEYSKEHSDLKVKLANAINKETLLQREFDALAVYEGTDLHGDKDVCALALHENIENTRELQTKQTNLRMKEYVLADLKQRLKRTNENQEKNKKRNRYSELLNLVNDTLQTSNFPRKLILNYAEVVSEHLQEKLQDFNMPYTARVADNFKIEMLDDNGNKLPTVSGGQEVQIGIALHIALHELFSQSFPLLIIDEGTTHLDATNRKAYFDIIKKLKSADKLQQIIIIDHDEGLEEVVDHIINLNERKLNDNDTTTDRLGDTDTPVDYEA